MRSISSALDGSTDILSSLSCPVLCGFRSRCAYRLEHEGDYTYIDFTFPNPLSQSGAAVRVELEYSLMNAVCTDEDGDLYLHEATSNQWLNPSMVQSTVYAVCMPSAYAASWNPQIARSSGQLLGDTETSAYLQSQASMLHRH